MKFSMRVKVMSLLAAVLVMLAGLPVVSAEAAGGITNPELNAFFDPNPRPGAKDALNVVTSGDAKVEVGVLGWAEFNKILGDEKSSDAEIFEKWFKELMAIKKSEGVNKVHFTLYSIEAKNSATSADIKWEDTTFDQYPGEVFLLNVEHETDPKDFFTDKWEEYEDFIIDMDPENGKHVGIFTFTPDGGLVPNPVKPTRPGVAIPQSVQTGTDVVKENPNLKLGSVTDDNGRTSASAVDNSNVDSATIIGLPVFAAEMEGNNQTAFMGYSTTLDDIAAKKLTVDDLAFLKRRANGTIVEFERIENPAIVENGQFAVTELSSPNTALKSDAPIKSGTLYLFSFGILDDGDYDWASDKPKIIIDPAAIAAKSTGGGGCSAGFGIVGLMLAGLAILKYRKNKFAGTAATERQ